MKIKYLIKSVAFALFVLLSVTGCKPALEDATSHTLTLEPKESVTSPGPYTTIRLILRLVDDRFQLVSAIPRRGSIIEPDILSNRVSLLLETKFLVEYYSLDDAETVLTTGYFFTPLEATVEYLDPNVRYKIIRKAEPISKPVVQVSIPYDDAVASIEFMRLEPDADEPPDKWTRITLGQVQLEKQREER